MPKLSYQRPIREKVSNTKEKRSDNNIVIIIHNTRDEEANAADFLHGLDIDKINCPRCKLILKRAKAMLETVSIVKNKETIGMCDMCKLREQFRVPCQYCQKAIEKFKSIEPLVVNKEDFKNELLSLLTSAKTNVIIMKGHDRLRAYSDIDITEKFQRKYHNSSLDRPKSGSTVYSNVQSTRDKKCLCLLQKTIEAKKIIINIKTQLDLKKHFPEKVKKDYHLEEKKDRSLSFLKAIEPHASKQIKAAKKTPYYCGLQSETVLGVGTTGILRRSHSDESLISSISGITQKMHKKNFEYFFPHKIKKKETNTVKTSQDLIRDTRAEIQGKYEEKLKKEEEQKLVKLEKQREKEAAIEEIKRKAEFARSERLSYTQIMSKENMTQKRKGAGREKGDNIYSEKSAKAEKNINESQEHIGSVEKRTHQDKDKEYLVKEKPETLIKETDTIKKEQKGNEKEGGFDTAKGDKKENEKLEKVEKASKQPEKEKRSDKMKEESKEKEKQKKVDNAIKKPDMAKAESNPKEKAERSDKIKEERKETEKQGKVDKALKKLDIGKPESKPKEKEEMSDKIKEERKEKEKPEKNDKAFKKPDIERPESKSKEKEDVSDKIKEERGEKEKPGKSDKALKKPDTEKTESKPKEKEDVSDRTKEDRKVKEKPGKNDKVKQQDIEKAESKPKEKKDISDRTKEERKAKEKPEKNDKGIKQQDIEKAGSKLKEKEEMPDKVKEDRKEKETPEKNEKVKTPEKLKGQEKTSENEEKISKAKDRDTPVKSENKGKEKDEKSDKEKVEGKGKAKQEQHVKGKSDKMRKVSKESEKVRQEQKGQEREKRKDAEKSVQKLKGKDETNKNSKEIDEKIQKSGREKEDGKGQDKKSGPAGNKMNTSVESKTYLKSKDKGKEDKMFLEKDTELLRPDKERKVEDKSAINIKAESTIKNKGASSKDEASFLNATQKKQEKQKLELMKDKKSPDAKFNKDMQAADVITGKVVSKPNKTRDIKNVTSQEKQEDSDIKGDKTKGKKGEEITAKDIKYQPSGDDLILKLVKTSRPVHELKTLTPLASPKPAAKVIRKVRKKLSVASLRSELELDAESFLREQMKGKKIIKPEIIYGENIYLEKDIPHKPEHKDKPALFESVFQDDSIFEQGMERTEIELLDEQKSDVGGVFRYALSDKKFIDNGWTVLPTQKIIRKVSMLETLNDRKVNMYRMHPVKPEFDWFERNKGKGPIQYDSGEKLGEVTENGRGRWYYKNGRLALDYYDSEDENAQQRVVIYSSGEPDERGRSRPVTVLGMFDHLGSGVVFDHRGKIRLKYNQNEGVTLDRELGPVTHWLWHSLNEPPDLQQVTIDTQLPFKEEEIASLEPDHKQPRPNDAKMLAIELDNFMKAKFTKTTQKFTPHQIRMKALKINNQFSLKILDQKTIYLLFREGSNTIKLNLGMTLDHSELLDIRTAEVNEVVVDIDKKPALTDSVANLQKSLLNVQRMDRVRTERELRMRPLFPGASADCLTAAAMSKPLRAPLLSATGSRENPSKCRTVPTANNLYYNTRLF